MAVMNGGSSGGSKGGYKPPKAKAKAKPKGPVLPARPKKQTRPGGSYR
jgi:hypothetical protein